MLTEWLCWKDTHFVYAAPKSMTIAVFSPPLPNPSNKGILLICYKIMQTLSVDRRKCASYQKDKEKPSCCLPVGLGWVLRNAMTSRGVAWSKYAQKGNFLFNQGISDESVKYRLFKYKNKHVNLFQKLQWLTWQTNSKYNFYQHV